ncbi:MAG: S26 family signal peptidase, partial [Planctomycetota bacterium]
GLLMEVKNVRVLRDFHVVPRGEFGVGRTLTIGTDQIFVLGDNSSSSRDSRDRGPIPEANVIGTAKAVVKPLSAFRWL